MIIEKSSEHARTAIFKYFVMLPILAVAMLMLCSFSESDSLIVEKTKQIVTEANIPLIQLEYSNGNHTLSFELSQVDSIPASEDGSTVFKAASLSKVVFAYIVLKMADRGEIDLDTPVYKYTNIGRFENKEWAKLITPRMVLAHRAGLSNWAAGVSTDKWPTSIIKFKYHPDSTFSYSGEAYAFLQRAVEEIRGKSIQEIAEEEVFMPFDMPNTSYGWKDSYQKKAANEYNSKGEMVPKQIYPRENVGYTLRTTAKEYSRFIRKAIVEGEGLTPATHRLMLVPRGIAHRNEEPKDYDKYIEWGLGIGIEHNEELGDIYHHWGDNGNFKAFFVVVPKQNKYLVYLTNSEKGHDIIDKLMPLFFGNTNPLHLSAWIMNK